MATEPTRSKRSTRRSDPRALLRFVEELSWLLSSYEDLDFRALANLSDDILFSRRTQSNLLSRSGKSAEVHDLVGVLPSFFTDLKLFPSNSDIVEFSEIALGIGIPRWEKKSKYELVGHVVCNTNLASPQKVERLVVALQDALDERSSTRQKIARDRESGRSWNEVIQAMLKQD